MPFRFLNAPGTWAIPGRTLGEGASCVIWLSFFVIDSEPLSNPFVRDTGSGQAIPYGEAMMVVLVSRVFPLILGSDHNAEADKPGIVC